MLLYPWQCKESYQNEWARESLSKCWKISELGRPMLQVARLTFNANDMRLIVTMTTTTMMISCEDSLFKAKAVYIGSFSATSITSSSTIVPRLNSSTALSIIRGALYHRVCVFLKSYMGSMRICPTLSSEYTSTVAAPNGSALSVSSTRTLSSAPLKTTPTSLSRLWLIWA